MEISEFTKQRGDFLKADVVKANPEVLFEITGEAEVVHNDKFNTDRLHIPVIAGTKEYTFDCSKTNARVISDKIGSDTKQWIGKHLILEVYKTKTSDGKMVDAINIKEVR